ncbi:MAG: chemotaxis protein CheB [Nitrospina sp.]|nr:chemotaxis protein CheB [Nitrospina sp.]
MDKPFYELIAIGGSAGSFRIVRALLKDLPAGFPIPLVVVMHVWKQSYGMIAEMLNTNSALTVEEAEEKCVPAAGHVYLAPGNYHLLLERDASFGLMVDPPVNYSRPSIDVFFESASAALGRALVGVLLTGANSDGALGMKRIGEAGGLTIVQDPSTAEASFMPAAALQAVQANHIVQPESLAPLLLQVSTYSESCHGNGSGKS